MHEKNQNIPTIHICIIKYIVIYYKLNLFLRVKHSQCSFLITPMIKYVFSNH